MPRAMAVRKGIYLGAFAGTILWLVLLLSGFSWSGWSEALSSFGRQQSHEYNGDLTKFTHNEMPVKEELLETLTEISQSAAEVPGSELLDTGYPSVLILSPLKKVSNHIDRYFTLLHSLSYPKNSISLGFLVSDSHDGSYARVRSHFLHRQQSVTNRTEKYKDVILVHQDFGYEPGDNWLDTHSLRNQIPRRAVLAKSRNYLLFSALRPHHDWVLWLDSDVSSYPSTLVEDLLGFTGPEKHILVPNSFWRNDEGEEQPYDRNSWRETEESRAFLEKTREVVVFEGYSPKSDFIPFLLTISPIELNLHRHSRTMAPSDRLNQLVSQLNYPKGLLSGQTAIITGGGQGIGAECCRLFANEGARVVVCDVDADKAASVVKAINDAAPGRAISVPGDVLDPGYFDVLVKKAAEFGGGKIHIIINNAGYTWDGVIHKMTDKQWDTILAVHNTAPFRLVRTAAPYFRVKDGEKRCIVNISSTSGTHGNAGQANYSLAKAGVTGLTKTIAKEWGPQFGVRANTVAFGHIDTRLTRAKEAGAFITTPDGEKVKLGIPGAQIAARKGGDDAAAAYKDIPLGRPGTATEAASSILAVVSPLFSYVNGQTIEVTGGRNM